MGQYSYQKRPSSQNKDVLQTALSKQPDKAFSNSSLAAFLGAEQSGISDLEQQMQVRTQALRHQIPHAEQEADRLSSGVTSGSFHQVKEEMGRRLGVDLSDVRLHTDDAAAAKADEMGAAAYTSGRDIYFGSGGYRPDTAAHELVHTAQQGVVSGGIVTAGVPMGTVQMKPLQLKNRSFVYRKDKAYQDIVKLVSQFNNAANDDERGALEAQLMSAASEYITENSTNGKDKHRGRRANLESLIYQLSASDKAVQQANRNIDRMRGDAGGSVSIGQSLDTLQSGINAGEANGKTLSPAMRAIMTETMASQERTAINPVGAGSNGFHPHHELKDGSMLNLGNSLTFFPRDAAALLHESTHAQIYNTYGSIVAASDSQRGSVEAMAQAEAMRQREMNQIEDAFMQSIGEQGAQAIGPSKIAYSRNGLLGDDYLQNAVQGAEGEYNQTVEDLEQGTESGKGPAKATSEGVEATRKHHLALKALQSMRNSQLNGSSVSRDPQTPQFEEMQSAYMVEHDPAMNEHLMNYEMNSTEEERAKSPLYRELKAAAIRAHVERHNHNLRKRLGG